MFTSKRGKPLLCQTTYPEKSIITLENYSKWYSIYLIEPDGSVTEIDHKIINEISDSVGRVLSISHNYHPLLLEKLGEKLDCYVDEISIEVATGRWYLEKLEKEVNSLPFE